MGEDRGKADFRTTSAVALLIRIFSAALSFVSQILLARWLGIDDYGVLTALWYGSMCSARFRRLDLPPASFDSCRNILAERSLALARGFHRAGMLAALLAGTLVSCLRLLLAIGVAALPESYQGPARVALLALPAFALADFLDGVGRSRGWVALALVPPYIIRPIIVLLAIAGMQAAGPPLIHLGNHRCTIAIWVSALLQLTLQARPLGAMPPAGPIAYDLRCGPRLIADAAARWRRPAAPEYRRYSARLLRQPERTRALFCRAADHLAYQLHPFRRGCGGGVPFCDEPCGGPPSCAPLRIFAQPAPCLLSLTGSRGRCSSGSASPSSDCSDHNSLSAWPVMIVLCIGLLARAAAGPAQLCLSRQATTT